MLVWISLLSFNFWSLVKEGKTANPLLASSLTFWVRSQRKKRLKSSQTMQLYLLNILHHNTFNFWNLIFHLRKLAYLLGMINTVLHVFLQFWTATKTLISNYKIKSNQNVSLNQKRIPKILVKAVCRSCGSLLTPISCNKVISDAFQESHGNLSSYWFICNHTISCNTRKLENI